MSKRKKVSQRTKDKTSEVATSSHMTILHDGTIVSNGKLTASKEQISNKIKAKVDKDNNCIIGFTPLRNLSKKRATRQAVIGYLLYALSFFSLLSGVFLCVLALYSKLPLLSQPFTNIETSIIFFILLLGFVIAISRYTYVMGAVFFDNSKDELEMCRALNICEYFITIGKEEMSDEKVKELLNFIQGISLASATRARIVQSPNDICGGIPFELTLFGL